MARGTILYVAATYTEVLRGVRCKQCGTFVPDMLMMDLELMLRDIFAEGGKSRVQ